MVNLKKPDTLQKIWKNLRDNFMDYIKLSKEISYALRHAPWEYELELDDKGRVSIDQLINSLKLNDEWEEVTVSDLKRMVELSDKKRHAIKDGKIGALYGHTIPGKIIKKPVDPPAILYHGTARRFLDSIKKKGLLPSGRQYVHLSKNLKTAKRVGKRKDKKPVILKIDARKAHESGILFYHGNENIWLADSIPVEYILF